MMNKIWLFEFESRTCPDKLYLCRNVRSEIMTKTIENFLRYVKIDTQSSEESTTTPSTMKQHDLAGLLVSELDPQATRMHRYLDLSPIWIHRLR